MGAFLTKCTKNYVECSKILHLPNFEKLLHEFQTLEFNDFKCKMFLHL
jgi:hypothetical protein